MILKRRDESVKREEEGVRVGGEEGISGRQRKREESVRAREEKEEWK